MRARGGLLALVVIAGLVAGGGIYLEREVGVNAAPTEPAGAAPSGAWLCPHGGGPSGWTAWLFVTNPGPKPVEVRVQSFGSAAPSDPQNLTVGPRARAQVEVPATGREASSLVEYFGGWVAAGWVAVAGGDESGTAAEPCLAGAGRSWILPDGTTVQGQDAWVVVMNPFASEAVFSLTLVTERRTVRTKDWSDFVLKARRSVAFHLNSKALGERTVVADVQVSIGRVAASSLGIASAGGIRSAVGVPAATERVYLPGGGDSGHNEVAVVDPSGRGVHYEVNVLDPRGLAPAQGLGNEQLGPGADRTYDLTAGDPATIVVSGTDGRIAAARRTLGTLGDQGSTGGVPGPAAAWVVSTTAATEADKVAVYLVNPGSAPVRVELWLLGGGGQVGPPITVEVPAGVMVTVPAEFNPDRPQGSVVAVAESGTFIPVEVSYSASGTGYAVAVGVPVPAPFTPSPAS
jgi:hypothetical protein